MIQAHAATEAMPGRMLVLAAVAAGYVSVMLAVSPVSVALPTMGSGLGINIDRASWVHRAAPAELDSLLGVGVKPVMLSDAKHP